MLSKQVKQGPESQLLLISQMAMHDTINKINGISMNMQVVLKDIYGKLPDDVRTALLEIDSQLHRAGVTVSDYMTRLSVMESGATACIREYDVRKDIINLVLRELALDIEKNNIQIDSRMGLVPDEVVMINADKLYLKVVFRNLIGNAINYGGPGTTISFGYEDVGDKWRFNVYNDGPPVPPVLIPLLFKRFKGEYRSMKGVGLALYSIKKMIESHGGEIWYETTESGHPNFVFTLSKN